MQSQLWFVRSAGLKAQVNAMCNTMKLVNLLLEQEPDIRLLLVWAKQ